MRTWALSAGLSLVAACSAVEVDPYVVPVDQLSENQRKKVEHVLEDVAVAVPLEVEEVKSRLEIYHFLLDEMPFTGGVVRVISHLPRPSSRTIPPVNGISSSRKW